MQKIWQRAFNILFMYSGAIWVCLCQPLFCCPLKTASCNFVVSLLSPIGSLAVKCILPWHLLGDRKLGSCHDLYQSYSKAFLQCRQERRAKGRLLLPLVGVSEGERTHLGWRAVGKALQSYNLTFFLPVGGKTWIWNLSVLLGGTLLCLDPPQQEPNKKSVQNFSSTSIKQAQ